MIDRYKISSLTSFNEFIDEYSDLAKIGVDYYRFDIPYVLNDNNELEFEILALEEYSDLILKYNIVKLK